ncbi:M48 family metallopeptidase [Thalassotalea sp. PS06]|uniref:M48 family metallopeptidase n=1 Tax=Thalassotalea sp. PS06 TaxID=2594005 RepID=UPI001162E33D|nr:SprT family zinc-dependent metalloprotease [Thalassotalea sp. PS06]QDP02245.1 M48 family metallopeptidase [Thalassotalea sp. PS06]
MFFKNKNTSAAVLDGIEIVRSARRKTLSLQIKAGKVRVLSPSWLDSSKIARFVAEKQTWIDEKLRQQQEILSEPKTFWLAPGEKIFIAGESWQIAQCPLQQFNRQQISADNTGNGDDFIETRYVTIRLNWQAKLCHFYLSERLFQHDEEQQQRLLSDAFNKFCQQRATSLFAARLNNWQGITGLESSSLKIRFYKSRWGSCDNQARITLNNRLVMAPDSVVDYVIVHELCHLVHQNHSSDFWALVEHFYPNFKKSKRWLQQHQAALLVR